MDNREETGVRNGFLGPFRVYAARENVRLRMLNSDSRAVHIYEDCGHLQKHTSREPPVPLVWAFLIHAYPKAHICGTCLRRLSRSRERDVSDWSPREGDERLC